MREYDTTIFLNQLVKITAKQPRRNRNSRWSHPLINKFWAKRPWYSKFLYKWSLNTEYLDYSYWRKGGVVLYFSDGKNFEFQTNSRRETTRVYLALLDMIKRKVNEVQAQSVYVLACESIPLEYPDKKENFEYEI